MGQTEVLFRGRKFDLVRCQVRFPDGSLHTRELVQHPGAVTILPLLGPDRLCLLKNFRPAAGEFLWELPAGTREPNEPPEQTARRELAEETGYRAGKLWRLTGFFTSPGVMTEWMEVFVAEELVPGEARPEKGELMETVVLPWSEVEQMLRQGEIQDGKTIASLLYYRWFAGEAGKRNADAC